MTAAARRSCMLFFLCVTFGGWVDAAQRTFVATSGVDNPACSLVAPCRAFAAAIAATSIGGEVVVLDSGGYGTVTITQSVSIVASPGVYAGITVPFGEVGVTIAAGANGKVVLRGLTLNGRPGGSRGLGILVTSARETHIEHCTVANMIEEGIRIDGGTAIHIENSVIRGNGQSGVHLAAGTPEVHVTDSHFVRNEGNGIRADVGTLYATRIVASDNDGYGVRSRPESAITVAVTLTDSMLSGNGGNGASMSATVAGSTVRMTIVRSTSARNIGSGFQIGGSTGNAFLVVSDSAALENGVNGVVVSGTNAVGVVTGSTLVGNTDADLARLSLAVLRSSLNNSLTGRGAADTSGTITPNPLQ